ncbi:MULTISPECIES: mechanosensitive ion channel family protein [Deferrisoma]
MVERLRSVFEALPLPPGVAWDLAVTAGVVLGLWALRRTVLRLVDRRVDDPDKLYHWRKGTAYAAAALGVLLVGRIWIRGFQSVATVLGLLSAGVAIALRDLLVNLAGWLFLVWRRPFEVGDRIQIGAVAGDVIDIRIFQFTLLEIGGWVEADQSTGRIVHVPNGRVFSEAVANYDKGFRYIWNELPVLVTFESDWRRAKEILLEIARTHAGQLGSAAQEKLRAAARRYMIRYGALTPTVYTAVRDSGVLLTIRYLCEPRRRRGTEQALWEAILEAFAAEPRIDFAYPTRRYFDHAAEGKPALREAPAPADPRSGEAPGPPGSETGGRQP